MAGAASSSSLGGRVAALVEDDEQSWQRRRALYMDRLRSRSGFLAIAAEPAALAGYALVCIERGPDDTFPFGAHYAELFSLSVAPDLRGGGIGTRLLDFVDRELARRTIYDLKVAVMEANHDARRLYERRGLRPAEMVLYRFGSHARETGRQQGEDKPPAPATSST